MGSRTLAFIRRPLLTCRIHINQLRPCVRKNLFAEHKPGGSPLDAHTMEESRNYLVRERLHDGRELEIRGLRPDDRAQMRAAIDRTGTQSLRRRFFGAKRGFSDREIDFFMSVNFVDHVALVALVTESNGAVIAGSGRYIVVEPGRAEMAFLVVDDYQRLGIGTALARNLIALARQSGLDRLVADVLPENTAMLALLKRMGFVAASKQTSESIQLVLALV